MSIRLLPDTLDAPSSVYLRNAVAALSSPVVVPGLARANDVEVVAVFEPKSVNEVPLVLYDHCPALNPVLVPRVAKEILTPFRLVIENEN